MNPLSQLNVGIVGACGRGASFKLACDSVGTVRIHAACDTNAGGLRKSAERLGASEHYTDFNEMLEKSELDALIIGTPMPLQVPRASPPSRAIYMSSARCRRVFRSMNAVN